MREMYARTVEREHGDEKISVIGKKPSRELDRREAWVWQSMRVETECKS